jgi:hypothetical protein
MRANFLTLLFLGAASLVRGQQASLTGPVSAMAFDAPSHSIRAVTGYPGSAMFGPPLVAAVDFATVAPHRNFALGFQRGTGIFATALDSGQAGIQNLDGLSAHPDGAVWSADGTLAVLYSVSGNWMQLITGLPSNPQVAARTDLAALPGTLAALAVDPRGKTVAVAISGESGGVFLFDASQQTFSPVLSMVNPAAVQFSQDGATLFAIDASSNELTVLNVADRTTEVIALSGLANPIAVRGSEDPASSQLVYVASASDAILRCYDLQARQVVSDTALPFAPTGIDAFGRNSFQIAARTRAIDPLWLFVTGPASGAYFVPALQPDAPRIEPVGEGSRRSASAGGAR